MILRNKEKYFLWLTLGFFAREDLFLELELDLKTCA